MRSWVTQSAAGWFACFTEATSFLSCPWNASTTQANTMSQGTAALNTVSGSLRSSQAPKIPPMTHGTDSTRARRRSSAISLR